MLVWHTRRRHHVGKLPAGAHTCSVATLCTTCIHLPSINWRQVLRSYWRAPVIMSCCANNNVMFICFNNSAPSWMNLMLQPCICYCPFTCVHIKHPDYEVSFIWMLASSLSLNPCQLTKADGITDCSSYLNAEFSFIFILKLLCTYVLWHWKLWYSAFIGIVVFVPDIFFLVSNDFLFLAKILVILFV